MASANVEIVRSIYAVWERAAIKTVRVAANETEERTEGHVTTP
jgi:hypothetical protein